MCSSDLHERRYTRASLTTALRDAGFEIDEMFDFNRSTTPGWWLNGKILRRRHFGRVQLKVMNLSVWLLRRIDSWMPWHGASLIAVARRT